jgi:glycosyltransferase involved in cell wall biosynthesis
LVDEVSSGNGEATNIRLTIAYSTLASRASNIKLPLAREDQEILIIVQNPDGSVFPAPPFRSDVRVAELSSQGVAKSRNAAIEMASGKYLVFADDDIEFNLENLDQVMVHLASCNCTLVLGQATDQDGNLRKTYPTRDTWLTRFNSAKAATYEMLINVSAIRANGIRFDEDFGAGAVNYLGDEYVFICDLLGCHLKAHFLPVTMAVHPTDSSGSGWGTSADLKARARVFTRVFGPAAFVVRALFILRNRDKVSGASNFLRFVFARF